MINLEISQGFLENQSFISKSHLEMYLYLEKSLNFAGCLPTL